jgi:acetyl esterase/lipase
MRTFHRIAVFLTLFLMAAPCWAIEKDDVRITPNVVYGHKFGLAMTFDVYQPKQAPNGAGVLFMVSGGWYSVWQPPEHALGRFAPLLERGFTVFSVRHGSSPKFTVPEAVDDVRRSVRYIRQQAERFDIDPERLGVFGGSAGGHLSLMLGTTGDDGDPEAKDEVLQVGNRVAAVVAYFPPTDLRPWVNPESEYYKNFPALRFEADKSADCSPLLHVTDRAAPTLLVHGDQDKLVPIDHSEKILAVFQEKQVPSELMVIKGAAHGFPGEDGRRASEALVNWFEKHLVPK